jgi:hypothetical protein
MIELKQLLDELIGRWRADSIDIRPGVTDDGLCAFEHRFTIELPLDVVTYLKRVDGMPDNAMDAELFRFWQLRELNLVSSLLPRDATALDRHFVFADHSIQAYHFSIVIGRASQGPVARVVNRPLFVASSFKRVSRSVSPRSGCALPI